MVTKPNLIISPFSVKVLPGFSIITPPLNDKALKLHNIRKSCCNMNVNLFPLPPLYISPPTLGRGCHKPWSWSSYLNPAAAMSSRQTSQPWESWVWNIKSCLCKIWLALFSSSWLIPIFVKLFIFVNKFSEKKIFLKWLVYCNLLWIFKFWWRKQNISDPIGPKYFT